MAARTFRKTLGTRIQSVLCAVLMVGLLLDLALAPDRSPWPSLLVVGMLALLSLVYVASAFGDRYVLEATGISYESRVLAFFRVAARRDLAFDDIASISEHRGRTLFLRDARGRRFVIDAVDGYVEIRDVLLYAHADRKRRTDAVPGPLPELT
ncbi:MAG: hypothetical protein U0166_17645 [Acidobacteriota bacterium]